MAEDVEGFKTWYKKWEDMTLQYEVHAEDAYNWDESPIRLGQYKSIKKVTALASITSGRNIIIQAESRAQLGNVSLQAGSPSETPWLFSHENGFMQRWRMAKLPGSYQIDVTPNGYHR